MYYVYILANKSNTVIYTGITNDLNRRLCEHKNKLIEGFTSKYNVNKLVYYCFFANVNDAIAFEKRVKGWRRSKKNELIESLNPNWEDLSCIV